MTMQIEVLKSKLHCVKVTEANLNYMGSITIDEDLMDAVGIIAGERVFIANAIKSFVMTLYTIVAIFVFMQHGSINWQYGLLHSVGTLVGSYIATRLAFKKGAGFIRWIVIIVIVFTSLYLFKIINLEYIFRSLIR